MSRVTVLALVCLLSACDAGPFLGAGVTVGPQGGAVRPHVSGVVGGLDVVVVSPPLR